MKEVGKTVLIFGLDTFRQGMLDRVSGSGETCGLRSRYLQVMEIFLGLDSSALMVLLQAEKMADLR